MCSGVDRIEVDTVEHKEKPIILTTPHGNTSLPLIKQKIVATVGPASNSKDMLIELVRAGVDVFRLNFSHGTHEGAHESDSGHS